MNDQHADVLDTARAGGLVVRGGLLRIAGFLAGIALSLVSVVLVTRHLGAVGYGRYQTVVALVAIVGAIADAGLGTVALRDHAQEEADAREATLGAVLGLRLTLTAAGVAIAALAAAALGYDTTMVAGAALGAGALILTAAQATLAVPLQTELRLGAVTALELARQVLTTAALAALVLAGAGLLAFLAVPLPVALAALLLTVAVARPGVRPVFDRDAWGRLLRVALAVGLATAAGVIYLYASLIVCGLVATPRETGWYSASFRVVIIVAAIPALLGTTAFPLLARSAARDRARLARVASGLVEGTFLLGGAAAVGIAAGAPAIIAVVAGSGYDPAIDALRIEGAALGLTFVISALGFTLLAERRHRALLTCNLVAFAAGATAVALLASAHGQDGAALGSAIGEAVLCTAYAIAVSRTVALRPRRVVRALPALALGLAAGLLLPVPAVPATAVALAVYAVAAWALGAVPPDVREVLPPTFRKAWLPGSD